RHNAATRPTTVIDRLHRLEGALADVRGCRAWRKPKPVAAPLDSASVLAGQSGCRAGRSWSRQPDARTLGLYAAHFLGLTPGAVLLDGEVGLDNLLAVR